MYSDVHKTTPYPHHLLTTFVSSQKVPLCLCLCEHLLETLSRLRNHLVPLLRIHVCGDNVLLSIKGSPHLRFLLCLLNHCLLMQLQKRRTTFLLSHFSYYTHTVTSYSSIACPF